VDPLGFVDQKPYPERVSAAQAATGLRDAAVWGTGRMDGRTVAICVMDFGFMGGSMGAVVGEKVARATEASMSERIPLIVVSASGGARMQEGTLSLMQLAKTMAALERLRGAEVPYISVMSDPTTGGVFASFAAVGDVNLAEPNALIGFAGARVSAGTIAAELPAGFQRAEFLFSHGFVDRVVARADLRDELIRLLRYLVPADRATAEAEAVDAAAFIFKPLTVPLAMLSKVVDRVLPEEFPNGRADGARGDDGATRDAEPSGVGTDERRG
jgi:acetyl-CoA carboxylase carboxyl transferase subunit beta